MFNDFTMTFEQNLEREQYYHFCRMNGLKVNKVESLNLYCSLIKEVKYGI